MSACCPDFDFSDIGQVLEACQLSESRKVGRKQSIVRPINKNEKKKPLHHGDKKNIGRSDQTSRFLPDLDTIVINYLAFRGHLQVEDIQSCLESHA